MRKSIAVVAVALGLGVFAPPALANGPCGIDYDGNHACGVNTPYAIKASLVTDNENDFYVFWGTRGAQVSVTITDTENPQACNSPSATYMYCGSVQAQILDASGNEVDGTQSSSPAYPGITVPASVTHTLESTGVYYIVVSGSLTQDANYNPLATAYSLNVSGNPGVQWPAPPPAPPPPPPPPPPPSCVVPSYHAGQRLAYVEHQILIHHCAVAKIRHLYNRHVRKGRVVALSPRPGGRYPNGRGVAIIVSRGHRR